MQFGARESFVRGSVCGPTAAIRPGIGVAPIPRGVLFCGDARGSQQCREAVGFMDELLKWREEFPILDRTTYLIINSLGAMPRSVSGRLADYADAWATRGVRAWEEGWWEMAVDAGDKIG